MMKRKKMGKCLVAGVLILGLLFTDGSYSSAVAKKEGKSDVKVQRRKDAGEFSKNEKGETKYVIYQKGNGKASKIRDKYKNKLEKENDNVSKFGNKNFTVAGITSQELEVLQEDENVIIEKDYLLEGSEAISDDEWQAGVDAVVDEAWDVKAVRADEANGNIDKKVKIAVLDSGLDKFSKLVVDGCINFVDPEIDEVGVDMTGHGTAVQNIIMSDESGTTESVAEENDGISMYSVKVLDAGNQASVSRIVSALHWCIDNEMDIINMSFGTLTQSKVLGMAIKEAADAGILMVAAAGNGGEAEFSNVEYPAAFDEVIGVGSVNQKMEVSEFSSRGEEIELVAPGENIPVSVQWGFYRVDSGTSFAAPHVTAVAGMLWAKDSTKTAEEIRSLLRASAKEVCEETEAGSGMVDYAYAEKLMPEYECEDEEKVSDTNDRELAEYDVPEVVQARWRSEVYKDISLENPITYTHENLIAISGYSSIILTISSEEINLLNVMVGYADSKNKFNDTALHDCRVMHAGRYEKNNDNNYVNYVAACRCLYNCAYLIDNEDADKERLKEYVNKHYNSGTQSASAIEDAKKDLRIIINAAYDNDLLGYKSKLPMKRIRTLQFLGFAIHAATDAFAHQYVVNTTDATPVVDNTRIERLQGSTKVNGNPVKTNISFTSASVTKSLIQSGTCNTKDLVLSAKTASQDECHRYYADNLSYVYARYDTGSRDCVKQMLWLFGSANKVRKFDPVVFINYSYNGEASGNERIPIWNLYENVKYAGYTPEDCEKNSISSGSAMKIAWERLSSWK